MAEKYIAESEIFEHQIMMGDGIAYVYDAVDKNQREFLSVIEEIEAMYDNHCCHKVDTYKSKGLAQRLGCEDCPAVVIIKDGKIYETLSDNELSKDEIIAAIKASKE
jgi:thioredoxin reductase (NADPH)